MKRIRPLWDEPGLRALRKIIRASDPLLAFDYDGTLTPIVEEPSEAEMRPFTVEAMRKLCQDHDVAVISGRSRRNLLSRLEFEPRFVVGNHGLEGVPGQEDAWRDGLGERCRIWRGRILDFLRDHPETAGTELEDKTYSLSLHLRRAGDPDAAERALGKFLGTIDPAPRLIGGKSVINVLPTTGVDKGSALNQLIRHSGASHALYVGDDDTDEDAFVAADHSRVLTLRVGYLARSKACFFIESQNEIDRLLGWLLQPGPGL